MGGGTVAEAIDDSSVFFSSSSSSFRRFLLGGHRESPHSEPFASKDEAWSTLRLQPIRPSEFTSFPHSTIPSPLPSHPLSL